jgi:hypothetical protein
VAEGRIGVSPGGVSEREWLRESGMPTLCKERKGWATREFPFSVQLAFSLQSGEERKGVNFRTRAELESEFIRTPPSLYLLRPEQEPRSQTGESRAKAGIRDMVLEKIDAAIFGIPVQTIRMLLLGIYRFKCG